MILLILDLLQKFGYEILDNHVDFYGICPKCKGKNPDSIKITQ